MDVPSTGSSLAEWSQKIKNLQQQVDEDGLQEQARLEAEIAKSRLDRARRRSTLTGNARIDQASASYLSKVPDDPQTDALQRLTANEAIPRPSSTSPTPNSSASTLPQPVSLAAFIGGRATGPRLNKHAPQADYDEHARDYEVRRNQGSNSMLQKIAQPSPVALHGLAKDTPKRASSTQAERKEASPSPSSSTIPSKFNRPSDTKEQDRVAKPEKIEQPKPASPLPIRVASTSSSSTTSSTRSIGQGQVASSPLGISPSGIRTSTSPPVTQPVSSSTPVTARWTGATSSSPLRSPPMSSPSPSSPPQVKSLARPVQPLASPIQHFVPPTNPSPAFLKPPPPKEERPSITRLKGRGFVEQQVKVSARLTSTPEEAPKVQKLTNTDRKLTVLQRWPGEAGSQSTNSTPEKPITAKREFTQSLPPSSVRPSDVAGSSSPLNFNKPVQTRARNFEHDSTPLRLPGMNGAGSLPTKSNSMPQTRSVNATKESPPVMTSAPMRLPGLATEGVTPSALRKSSSSSNLRQPSKRRSVHFDEQEEDEPTTADIFDGNQTDVTNAKKLTHLTKDRARKPKKGPTHSGTTQERTKPARSPLAKEINEPDVAEPTSLQSISSKEISETALPVAALVTDIKPDQPVSKPRLVRSKEPTVSSPAVPATPITPASARPPSREKNKLPPPIIAPKPTTLRRDSLNSPMTPKQVSTPSTVAPVTTPSKAYAPARTPSPSRGDESEVGESPKINVRAAISAWGKQPQESKKVDRERPVSDSAETISKKHKEPQETDKDHSPTQVKQVLKETETIEPPIIIPSILNPPTIPMPQPRPRPAAHSSSERRRSITNRYSSIILPPLKEEKTPAATPEGSLKNPSNAVNKSVPTVQALHASLAAGAPSQQTSEETEMLPEVPKQESLVVETEVEKTNGHSPISPLDRIVTITHEDSPIPSFNLSRLLASIPVTPKVTPGSIISVEAFVISGSSSTAIKANQHIFYENEIIATVYRGKSKTSGLVATSLWAWIGAKAAVGDKEETKLQEMANRFNTSLVKVPQGKEPFDLIQIMGGMIAIRHSLRSHWTPENTALHCVRTHGSHFIIIEEVDLMSRNICSAFSYCLAILDALFVWYGRGSTEAERQAALTYATSIKAEGVSPVEVEEGAEDEMFWMMFDEGGYANADFWKFRAQSPIVSSRLWAISDGALQPVLPFCSIDLAPDKVFMYDGIFELFVIVGEEARAQRDNIRLALAAAESLAAASAVTRTFPPPVHVLVFPTRIPIDLRANFRLMDYHEANKPVPDHINLLTLGEARAQLNQTEWKLRALNDPNFLPLGISPSMHSDFTQ